MTEHTTIRRGGDVAIETLGALGAREVVGIPGQHALGLFDALRRSSLRLLSARVELNAGFMADGLARRTGTVAPLFLSTGPGALGSLPALQEAAASSVPILVVAAQIPTAGLGGGRHGYLHELPDQSAAFRGVVKSTFTVRTATQIPAAITAAWGTALSAPQGPVLVEIPQDVLLAPVGEDIPPVEDVRPSVVHPQARAELIASAADLLRGAKSPVILSGGGVQRAEAVHELRVLAERLAAPVVTTFSGKGVLPEEHPLAAGSWIEDVAYTELLEQADVLLVVGSGVGELSSNSRTFSPRGRVIHIEADLGKLNANFPGLGIHSDARVALSALIETITDESSQGRESATRVRELKATLTRRLDAQDLGRERALLAGLRDAIPSEADTFWDMTILAYWAWSGWDRRDGTFASAQGAGGLGYALPAAAGAAFVQEKPRRPVVAISGDGGAMYGIAELAAVAQQSLDLVWVVIDDGGYGILEEYMTAEFGIATATRLVPPDFVALAESFGISAVRVDPEDAPSAVAAAVKTGGPAVVVVSAKLRMFEPTHLDRLSLDPAKQEGSTP
ncbi:thiamine pyrophosphate-binding protein [Homoserinimonas sp. A447]